MKSALQEPYQEPYHVCRSILFRIILTVFLAGSPFLAVTASAGQRPYNLAKPAARAASWQLEQQSTAKAQLAPDKDAIKVTVTKLGAENWHAQMWQALPPLHNGRTYTLIFSARADKNRTMGIAAAVFGGDYHDIGLPRESLSLTPRWRTFRRSFVASRTDNLPCRLPYFILGDTIGAVWIRGVTVVPGPYAAPVATKPPAGTSKSPTTTAAESPADTNTLSIHAKSGAATLRREGGSYHVEITKAAAKRWDIELGHGAVNWQELKPYVFKFRARSRPPRDISLFGQSERSSDGLWANIGLNEEWQQFEVPFRPHRKAPGSGYVFELNTAAGDLWIDSISVAPVGEPPPPVIASEKEEGVDTAGRWPREAFQTYPDKKPLVKRYLIALLQFDDSPQRQRKPTAHYRKLLSSAWPYVGHYYRSISYGNLRIEGDATEWIHLRGSWRDYTRNNQGASAYDPVRLGAEVAARYSLAGYDGIIFNVDPREEAPGPGNLHSNGNAGAVRIQGRPYVYCMVPYFEAPGILVHEMGHTLGLDHVAVPADSGKKVYQHRWDAMGAGASYGYKHPLFGPISGEMNAFHKLLTNWIKSERTFVASAASSGQTVAIERLGEPITTNPVVAIIDPGGDRRRFWVVESRLLSGYDFGAQWQEGVLIWECRPGRDWRRPQGGLYNYTNGWNIPNAGASMLIGRDGKINPGFNDTTWHPGMTYTNAETGFKVEIVSRYATGFMVRITSKSE